MAREFAYEQSKQYEIPPIYYLELSVEKGQWLAREMNANEDVVLLGTFLMDC